MLTVNAVKSNCSPISGSGTGITMNDNKLDQSVNVFPNPSNTGKVTLQLNLSETADLVLEIYDISGRKLQNHNLRHVQKRKFYP